MGIGLKTANREAMVSIIVQQRDLIIRHPPVIDGPEKRVARLQGQAKSRGGPNARTEVQG